MKISKSKNLWLLHSTTPPMFSRWYLKQLNVTEEDIKYHADREEVAVLGSGEFALIIITDIGLKALEDEQT